MENKDLEEVELTVASEDEMGPEREEDFGIPADDVELEELEESEEE